MILKRMNSLPVTRLYKGTLLKMIQEYCDLLNMSEKKNYTNLRQESLSGFPAELVSKSSSERLQYFKDYTVGHPVLSEVFEKLWRAILDPQPGSTIMIYGPAGVGKSTLCGYLEKRIGERFADLLEANREMIPMVKVEASNPVKGEFDWKNLFREVLIELGEPAIGQKIDPVKYQNQLEEYQKATRDSRTGGDVMRDVYETALKYRRPKGVLIDEAQHMCVTKSGKKLVNQPNSIKSIANRTETTHILFGSYDLLTLRNLNGQLSRRTIQLHFRRYSDQNTEDIKIFRNTLKQFQAHLPISVTIDLALDWKFIYSRSIGCIGIVKEWLNRSLSAALDKGGQSLTKKHLEESALNTSQVIALLDESENGEEKLEEEEISQDKLVERFSFIDEAKPKKEVDNPNKPINENNKGKGKNSSGVGVRNPKRDEVGVA